MAHRSPVVAVDSLAGHGIDDLHEILVARLTEQRAGRRESDPTPDTTRLSIDRVFTVRGAGTVVTGMLASGRLRVGQDIEVAPHGLTGSIHGLQALEQPVEEATAPSRVAANVSGTSTPMSPAATRCWSAAADRFGPRGPLWTCCWRRCRRARSNGAVPRASATHRPGPKARHRRTQVRVPPMVPSKRTVVP